MSSTRVELQGTLGQDGAIHLNKPVDLPPGQVRVIVESLEPQAASPNRFWTMMDEIWAGQRARGHQPRSAEEVNAEISALHNDAAEELLRSERTNDECQRFHAS